jgi:death-on-curing protein
MVTSCRCRPLKAVKSIHAEVLVAGWRAAGMRDEALQESALAAPPATKMGETLFTNSLEIAVCLFRDHPIGNKHTALVTYLIFLRENRLLPRRGSTRTPWESLIIDVAAGHVIREQTTNRLRAPVTKSARNSSAGTKI